MPLEIRELVVKVVVEESAKKPLLNAKELQELKAKIIRDCTEKIMQKLENVSER
jgi:uncharacterized protein DUF5908